MTNVLHISSSPRGEVSESIALADAFLTGLAETRPDVDVEHWDLWDGTLPEFGPPARVPLGGFGMLGSSWWAYQRACWLWELTSP